MTRAEDFAIRTITLLAGIPNRFSAAPPFQPPQKILILKPRPLKQILAATSLLAALSSGFPDAKIDWAVSAGGRPALISNPHIHALIDTGEIGGSRRKSGEIGSFVQRIRQERYDSCFILDPDSILAYIAWQAGIRQRAGFTQHGIGSVNNFAVPMGEVDMTVGERYLKLAQVAGIDAAPPQEFYPTDGDRTAAAQLLAEQVGWLGKGKLIILNPGGDDEDDAPAWQLERFVRLGNQLVRELGARLILMGDEHLTQTMMGLLAAPAADLAGKLPLGMVGALGEAAHLYVGNDVAATHIAASMGCPTIAIYPAGDEQRCQPFLPGKKNFRGLAGDISVGAVMAAADDFLTG